MEPQHPDDLSITEQAFEWYDVLRTGGARERAAFAEWLRTSPRHVGEFLSVTAVYQEHAGVPFTQD
ncbi:FecR/PupR family sigma factor regulator, partial [Steroidobacter sp.]|uniref:FecR/PupR family sigma factor regulator n=1 Tax=Steroidobacter sp. TaxID=1978227 RepID=UPI001A3C2821